MLGLIALRLHRELAPESMDYLQRAGLIRRAARLRQALEAPVPDLPPDRRWRSILERQRAQRRRVLEEELHEIEAALGEEHVT